jgi:hypothetical protein
MFRMFLEGEDERLPSLAEQRGWFLTQQVWKPLICSLKKTLEHDARSTGLLRSMHAWQLSPEATGPMLAR